MNILLVLAGNIPRDELLETSIAAADLTVAVDGGAQVFYQNGFSPNLIIGDLDSFQDEIPAATEFIKISEQNRTDLQKSIDHITSTYQPKRITILGALGGRSDHLFNNLLICAHIDPDIELTLINDRLEGSEFQLEQIIRITPATREAIRADKGSIISIIQVGKFEGLNSKGLKWEINNACSDSNFICQSNVAMETDPSIALSSGCVYVAVIT